MNENVRAFLDKISEDREWIEGYRDIEDRDTAISIAVEKATELGIPLSADDFEPQQEELSEDELASIVGAGRCSCALGGGGSDDNDGVCACVMVGCSESMSCILIGYQ